MTCVHLCNVVAIMLGTSIACAVALQTETVPGNAKVDASERKALTGDGRDDESNSPDKIMMARETIVSSTADALPEKDDPVQKRKLMRRRMSTGHEKAYELMRRSTKKKAYEKVAAFEEYDGRHMEKAHASQSKVKSASKPEKLTCAGCNRYDYVVGKSRENSCRNEAVERRVNDSSMCRYAARRTKAHVEDDDKFLISLEMWEKRYPRGCFHIKCQPSNAVEPDVVVDDSGFADCFYFNMEGTGTISDEHDENFMGTPICAREFIHDGAADGNLGVSGCSESFSPVMDINRCQEMCAYEMYECDGHFQVGVHNYSQHFDHPQGCFYMNHTGSTGHEGTHVFYNPVNSTDGQLPAVPVKGTVICEVSNHMDFANNPPEGVSSGAAVVFRDGQVVRLNVSAVGANYRRRARRRGAQSGWAPAGMVPGSHGHHGSENGGGWSGGFGGWINGNWLPNIFR